MDRKTIIFLINRPSIIIIRSILISITVKRVILERKKSDEKN